MTAVFLLLAALAPAPSAPAQTSEADLKPGPGVEVVSVVCTSCHTADIILASHMTRATWDTTLQWMIDEQGLAPLEPDVRERILDYLAETQGLSPEDLAADSPWATPRYRPNPLW